MTLPTRRVCIKRGQKFIKTAGLLVPVALFGAGQNSNAGDAASDKIMQFSIPAQSLASALTRFSADTRLQVLYEGDVADKIQAPALNGTYTPAQALEKLLGGSGLKSRYTNDKTITLEAKPISQNQSVSQPKTPTLKAMTVTGKTDRNVTDPYNQDYVLPNATSGTKTDTPIMETPLNVQVISKQVLKDQQVTRIDQALKNVSGATFTGGLGAIATAGTDQNIILRGFGSQTYLRNGFRLQDGAASREFANVENIEVLKGSAAILYGQVEPGGVVNVITKQPQAQPYYSAQQQFGSYDFYRTSVDATGPLTKDDTLLYRMNLSYENSGSFREFINNEKVYVAPVLKWNISPRTQATLELEYTHGKLGQDIGMMPVRNKQFLSVPISRNYGDPSDKNLQDTIFGGFNWSHQFNDDWSIKHRRL
jgi:iron complex outermembrane receptor protein